MNTTAGNPAWEIRSTSGNKPKLISLGFINSGTTNLSAELGIGRPTNIGITPTSPQSFVDEDDGNAPSPFTTGAVAWGTAPTQPAAFNRRYMISSANIGAGFIAKFPGGYGMAASGSIVLWILNPINIGDAFATVYE